MSVHILPTSTLKVEVLDFLTENSGVRYDCGSLARDWSISVQRMKRVLDALLDEDKLVTIVDPNSNNRRRWYFVDLSGEYSPQPAAPINRKVFTQGPEWDTVRDRLKDYRKIPSKG